LPSSVLIKRTRRAYLSTTEPPDAKSFVRNILSISSLKPKILARSRLQVSHSTRPGGEGGGGYLPTADRPRLRGHVLPTLRKPKL
jgi:hypothetical protein